MENRLGLSRRPCARLAGMGGGALRSAVPSDHRSRGWPPPNFSGCARWPFPLLAEAASLPFVSSLLSPQFGSNPFECDDQPQHAHGEQGYPHAYIDEPQQQGQDLHSQRQSNRMATSFCRKTKRAAMSPGTVSDNISRTFPKCLTDSYQNLNRLQPNSNRVEG